MSQSSQNTTKIWKLQTLKQPLCRSTKVNATAVRGTQYLNKHETKPNVAQNPDRVPAGNQPHEIHNVRRQMTGIPFELQSSKDADPCQSVWDRVLQASKRNVNNAAREKQQKLKQSFEDFLSALRASECKRRGEKGNLKQNIAQSPLPFSKAEVEEAMAQAKIAALKARLEAHPGVKSDKAESSTDSSSRRDDTSITNSRDKYLETGENIYNYLMNQQSRHADGRPRISKYPFEHPYSFDSALPGTPPPTPASISHRSSICSLEGVDFTADDLNIALFNLRAHDPSTPSTPGTPVQNPPSRKLLLSSTDST